MRAFAFETPEFDDLNSLRASAEDNSEAGVLFVLWLEGDWASEPLDMVVIDSELNSVVS
jgi:hypothetical protein